MGKIVERGKIDTLPDRLLTWFNYRHFNKELNQSKKKEQHIKKKMIMKSVHM
jgi:hypothetical protein